MQQKQILVSPNQKVKAYFQNHNFLQMLNNPSSKKQLSVALADQNAMHPQQDMLCTE